VKELQLTLDELLACYKYFRKYNEQEKENVEVNVDIMHQFMRGINMLSQKNNRNATWPIHLESDTLWKLTRLVDVEYRFGTTPTGMNTHLKVINAIVDEPSPLEDSVYDEIAQTAINSMKEYGTNCVTKEDYGE
jgi:hypothetical protein